MLSEYLDGQLSPARCDEMEKHIQGCLPCRAFVASLKQSVAASRQCQPDRLDPAVAARTRALLLAACRGRSAYTPRKDF